MAEHKTAAHAGPSLARRQTQQLDSFNQLKQQGLADIVSLSGKRWTDYNLHDPGITLLEQLCFSLTELQYRCDFDINQLLSNADGQIDYAALGLVAPQHILTSRPTTAADYRRYLLDQLPELADIYLQADDSSGLYRAQALVASADIDVAQLEADIRRCYSAQRNLGEQLGEVNLLTPLTCQPVAEIEIRAAADPVELLAEFYYCCQQLLQRSTERQSYADLLAQGHNYTELFDGPLTPGGVLQRTGQSASVQLHEFFQPLQSIAGVVQLTQFALRCNNNLYYDSLPLQQGLALYALQLPGDNADLSVQLLVGTKAVSVDITAVMQRYQQKLFRQQSRWQTDPDRLCPLPQGHYRPVAQYHSLQHLLPAEYKLALSAAQLQPPQWQLKGYLLLFEQLLANFLAQLQQLPALFSPGQTSQSYYWQTLTEQQISGISQLYPADINAQLAKLYQQFDNVLQRKHRLLDYLLALYGESLYQHSLQHYDYYHSAASSSARRLAQKIRYLKHIVTMTRDRVAAPDHYAPLWRDAVGGFVQKQAIVLDLGQMAQSLTTAVLQYKLRLSSKQRLQSLYLDETRADNLLHTVPAIRLPFAPDSAKARRRLASAVCLQADTLPQQMVQGGVALSNYRISLQQQRYQLLLKVPGSQHDEWWLCGSYRHYRSALILANCLSRFLCHISHTSEGLHLVEHVLLLSAKARARVPADFYAGRITILCPNWTARFADAGFQQLVSESLQLNCPAHLSCQVLFISFERMHRFERLFKYWRSAMKAQQGAVAETVALAQYLYALRKAAGLEDADAPAD
ncbi:MAG: hypothetical protein KKE30_15350 [Gammaproteobacteria bacterium]|nr:hypothetical protein [Gammaproteobacteria bacterium]MBU1554706.1 hypothetical protein [Gammaproteobacteria bacterium]MBU2071884.1 hypothetical protein [Gammaproteobacteria bacterium]MBU2181745.1 hypothetical protein [Gammaproteobacteria bacterium]MBU2206333.1 hypothetical protein [Gammaproteobacteria bacterium]